MTNEKLYTQLVQIGRDAKYTQKGVNPIIQRSSSIIFDSLADKQHATTNRSKQALFYGRRGTQTHFAFQQAMTELEEGAGCVLYPSGAAAITNSILAFIQADSHIVVSGAVYDPTQNFAIRSSVN